MLRIGGAVARGALRPVPWLVTLGAVAVWAVCVRLVGPPTAVRTFFLLIQGVGWISGLGAAFLTSRDVDPPWPVIAVTPRPRRIWAIRWSVWLVGGLAICLALGASVGRPQPIAGLLVTWVVFSCFTLSSAVVAVLSDFFGGLIGAVVAVALILVAFLVLPVDRRPVVEIEYLYSVSHWVWQAVVTAVLLGVLAVRARFSSARSSLSSWLS